LEFGTESKKPPEQLPIVLQVLLSQQHRQRALDLLAQFIDLGMLIVRECGCRVRGSVCSYAERRV
jgi:hypothetical protein